MRLGDFRRSTSAFSSRISWNAIASTSSRFADFFEEFKSFILFVWVLKVLGCSFLELFAEIIELIQYFCLLINEAIVVFHDSTILGIFLAGNFFDFLGIFISFG